MQKTASTTKFHAISLFIIVLIFFVTFALFMVFKTGYFPNQNFIPGKDGSGMNAIFASSIIILFAYTGFQAVSSFTSDIEGGSKKAAKAILLS